VSLEQFRTGWFIESVVSACLVVLVIRTRRPFWTSRPARSLLSTTILVMAATVLLPICPFAGLLGLAPLDLSQLLIVVLIVLSYAASAEWVKRIFYEVHLDGDGN
jgi:Mg2+-importing ATPase